MTQMSGNNGMNPQLQQRRRRWLDAYQQKDTTSMADIETKEFFVVYYQNVEKKSQWHSNILATTVADDILLRLDAAGKIRVDELSDNNCVITSYFKSAQSLELVKEMWVKDKDDTDWQISSLALTKTA